MGGADAAGVGEGGRRRPRRRAPQPLRLQRLLDPERERRGNQCEARWDGERCPTRLSFSFEQGVSQPNLEFAHTAETRVVGRGRGGMHRAYDIRKHPEAYRLVCRACHRRMDRLDWRDGKGRWRAGPAEELPGWAEEMEAVDEREDVGPGGDG